ncbi:MAG TPA: alanine dehydrogenase [Firmicutes bacterium]|nr:alanine dehydrogenase [Bacillota bacterium]
MLIAVPRERVPGELRVAVVPNGAAALTRLGHRVLVEEGAGAGSGWSDAEYAAAGAEVVSDLAALYQAAEVIVKVKEPVEEEVELLRAGQVLLAFLMFSKNRPLLKALLQKQAVGLGWEKVQGAGGVRPVLAAMSEISGQAAVLVAADLLRTDRGGPGLLLGGVSGLLSPRVVILGPGRVGRAAARAAAGLGAQVVLVGHSLEQARALQGELPPGVATVVAQGDALARCLAGCQVLINTVTLGPGERGEHLVARADLKLLAPGAVIIDVAVDEGGAVETSRPTTWDDPIYVEEGVRHLAVPNLPARFPRTATTALATVVLPYLKAIAAAGWRAALRADAGLRAGLACVDGRLTDERAARLYGLTFHPAEDEV